MRAKHIIIHPPLVERPRCFGVQIPPRGAMTVPEKHCLFGAKYSEYEDMLGHSCNRSLSDKG